MTPKVSVVIPTYNRKDLVCQAIESVLRQTYRDYELIVVDDGSSDGTGKAVARFGHRLTYIWQENQGESVARNKAVALASGEYIALLDSDDIWDEHKLEAQIPILDNDSGIVILGTASWIIDEQGQRVGSSPVGVIQDPTWLTYEALRLSFRFFGPSSSIIRKSALLAVGGFASHIRYGEDWDLWLRLSRIGRIEVLPMPLTSIRRHAATQSSALTPESIDRRLADHVSILQRNPPLESKPGTQPRDLAMARVYLRAAMDDISIKRLDVAQERLGAAVSFYDANGLGDMACELALARAVALAEPTFVPDAHVMQYLDAALSLLGSAGIPVPETRSHVRARLFLSLATMARSRRDWPLVRVNLGRALKADAGSWRWPGFLGGFLESMLGDRVFNGLAGALKRR